MKPSKFASMPRTNKGTLTILAKQETAKDDGRIGEIPAAVVEVLKQEDTAAVPAELIPPAAMGAPTEAAPAPTPPTTKGEPSLFALGKKYAPKTDRNSETWGKLTKALNEGPKTMKELAELVKGHGDFLGYMTRGGHIVPHVPKKEEVVTA